MGHSFRKNIARFRDQKGVLQDDLAYKADIDRTYISGIEHGHRNPTIIVLWQLAEALGVRAYPITG